MPHNWKTYRLEEVCNKIYSGGTPSTSNPEFWNGVIPWLSSGETRNRIIKKTEKRITGQGLKNSSARMAFKGDTVIASAGQGKTRGQTSYLTIDTAVNQSVICLSPNRVIINDRYLFYELSSRYNKFRQISDSFSTRGSLTTDLLKTQIQLVIPTLHVQDRIASILGALDDKIELNLEMNKTLEEMAMALYKHWFVDFGPFKDGNFVKSELGMIPERWEIYNLQDVCDKIYSGGTPSTKNSEFWNGDIPWLSSGETREGYIVNTDKFITDLGLKKSSARMAHRGDTVIASAGQGKTRGQTSYLFMDTTINQSVLCLTANNNKISPGLLFYDLRGRYDQFRMISDSFSTRGSLTTKLMGDQIKLVLPNKQIQSEVEKSIDLWLLQIESNLRENITLTKLRDTLLPKLISGEIEVKEAEEEVSRVV